MLGKVWLYSHKKIITNENLLKVIQVSYILKSKTAPRIITIIPTWLKVISLIEKCINPNYLSVNVLNMDFLKFVSFFQGCV